MTGIIHLGIGVVSFAVLLFLGRLASLRFGAGEDDRSGIDPETRWTKKESLRLLEVVNETPNIKTFRFVRLNNKEFPPFKAGQFLTFQIGQDPRQVRSYSISSSPVEPRATIEVAVKKLDGGFGSQWFHNRKAGDTIIAYPPTGHFTDHALGSVPRIYIAGGIGITPLLSMIQTHLEIDDGVPLTLIYGARTVADLAFHSLLKKLSQDHANFRYVPILSNDESGDWTGARGYISLKFIQQHAGIDSNSHFFICGPAILNENLSRELSSAGVADERIHDEKFVSPTLLDPGRLPDRDATIRTAGQSFLYSGRQSLLDFLEEHGHEIPSACRTGVCGTCKCLVKGETESLTDAGLTRAEKKLGYALTCVTFPKANSTVEVE